MQPFPRCRQKPQATPCSARSPHHTPQVNTKTLELGEREKKKKKTLQSQGTHTRLLATTDTGRQSGATGKGRRMEREREGHRRQLGSEGGECLSQKRRRKSLPTGAVVVVPFPSTPAAVGGGQGGWRRLPRPLAAVPAAVFFLGCGGFGLARPRARCSSGGGGGGAPGYCMK